MSLSPYASSDHSEEEEEAAYSSAAETDHEEEEQPMMMITSPERAHHQQRGSTPGSHTSSGTRSTRSSLSPAQVAVGMVSSQRSSPARASLSPLGGFVHRGPIDAILDYDHFENEKQAMRDVLLEKDHADSPAWRYDSPTKAIQPADAETLHWVDPLRIHAVYTEQRERDIESMQATMGSKLDAAVAERTAKIHAQARAEVSRAADLTRKHAESSIRAQLAAKDQMFKQWALELQDKFQAQKDEELFALQRSHEAKVSAFEQDRLAHGSEQQHLVADLRNKLNSFQDRCLQQERAAHILQQEQEAKDITWRQEQEAKDLAADEVARKMAERLEEMTQQHQAAIEQMTHHHECAIEVMESDIQHLMLDRVEREQAMEQLVSDNQSMQHTIVHAQDEHASLLAESQYETTQLRGDVHMLQDRVEGLEQDIETLEQEKDQMARKLLKSAHAQAQMEVMQNEHAEEMELRTSEVAKLQEEVRALDEARQALQQQLSALESQNSLSANERVITLEEEVITLQAVAEERASRASDAAQQNAELQQELDQLVATMEEQAVALQDARHDAEQLRVELAVVVEQSQQSDEQAGATATTLQQTNAMLEDAKAQLLVAADHLADSHESLEQREAEVAELTKRVAAQTDTISLKVSALALAEARVDRYKNKAADIKRALDAQISGETIDELEEHLRAITQQAEQELKQQRESMEGEINAARLEGKLRCATQSDQHKVELNQVQRELNQAQREAAARVQEVTEAQRQCVAVEAMLEAKDRTVHAQEQLIQQLQASLQHFTLSNKASLEMSTNTSPSGVMRNQAQMADEVTLTPGSGRKLRAGSAGAVATPIVFGTPARTRSATMDTPRTKMKEFQEFAMATRASSRKTTNALKSPLAARSKSLSNMHNTRKAALPDLSDEESDEEVQILSSRRAPASRNSAPVASAASADSPVSTQTTKQPAKKWLEEQLKENVQPIATASAMRGKSNWQTQFQRLSAK